MDKNAIKKYAVWARRELISRVSQRAALYEITDKGYGDVSADSVLGRVMSVEEKRQRQALITQIREKGYEQVMEEIAYTWFNRFIALRFMEVNGYLPSRVRVFTDEENSFKPQILTEAINMELDGLDMAKVYALKTANDDDSLFKYMIIVQCNALSSVLPGMFQRISDYTELLFPDNLLRDGSVIEQMVTMIPEEDWTDQVQIIGWLYQYYNIEPKDKVFADLKNNIKISKENIPAATQLFTPDWIVRYMVENSLGRLWLEGHPNDELKASWDYYLDEAEQEAIVQTQLAEIRKEYTVIKPEDILVIDPCQGSGHILAYVFDVLVKIYEAYGYTSREAATSIVEHNIWGLDIDDRAAQLAYFSVMMKARQYDRRFLTRGVQPHVFAIKESDNVDQHCIRFFIGDDKGVAASLTTLISELKNAKEYGSLIDVSGVDFPLLYSRLEELQREATPSLYSLQAVELLLPLFQVGQALAQKYHVVITNPPYMGGRNMNASLLNYITKRFPEGKADLFSAFILRVIEMIKKNGYMGMITMHSWMFLSSFEQLREKLLQYNFINMSHLGARAFEEISGEVVQTTSWILRKSNRSDYCSTFVRLLKYGSQDEKEVAFISHGAPTYIVKQFQFDSIPGKAFGYWLENPHVFSDGTLLERFANPRQGLKTLDNDYFIRFWFEVEKDKICFTAQNSEQANASGKKWFPLNHGGEFRKYYGNNFTVVNWEHDGSEMKANAVKKYNCITRTITNIAYYFKEGITWSVLCSEPSFRWYGAGFIFSNGGQCIVPDSAVDLYYLTGLLNSKISGYLLNMLSPTLGFESGYLKKLPIIISEPNKDAVSNLAKENITLSKQEWDDYEISWDFERHPLRRGYGSLRERYLAWEKASIDRFNRVRDNEEELNRIFIGVYGLDNSIESSVDKRNVSLRVANQQRDIKSLLSYAVGCMFGRYSLDTDGVVYSGGNWDSSLYRSYIPDKDGIIPICDDEYFRDDVVGRFVDFISVAFGSSYLEDNLAFISESLGGKGSPRDVIRDYFLNDFYSDHVKTYQKCPIYWMFDSGRKNGFKCLVYIHRFRADTIARIRTDYVHEQQSRYRTAIADLESRIASAGTAERVRISKQLTKINDQAEELRVFEEKVHHLADQMLTIDLDRGVKKNYALFKDVLSKL